MINKKLISLARKIGEELMNVRPEQIIFETRSEEGKKRYDELYFNLKDPKYAKDWLAQLNKKGIECLLFSFGNDFLRIGLSTPYDKNFEISSEYGNYCVLYGNYCVFDIAFLNSIPDITCSGVNDQMLLGFMDQKGDAVAIGVLDNIHTRIIKYVNRSFEWVTDPKYYSSTSPSTRVKRNRKSIEVTENVLSFILSYLKISK